MNTKANPVWSNWSGAVNARPAAVWRPGSEEELAALIKSHKGGAIRPAGAGHSFTPLCAGDGAIVSLENMSGIISADRDSCEVELWAGTNVYAAGPVLHAYGLALPNQGDVDRQTLAGAISTGTHGTGSTLGALATAVEGVTLVTGTGDIVRLDRRNNPEMFEASRVSLGALGVITRFRLKLIPSYPLQESSWVADATETINRLEELDSKHRHFEFFWFPYADMVAAKSLNTVSDIRPDGAFTVEEMKARGEHISSDQKAFEKVCKLVKLLPFTSKRWHRFLTSQMAGGETKHGRVRWSWETFPSPRTTRFNEMEYAVPREHAASALKALAARIRKDRIATAFPIEFRFVKGDDIWMSPFYGRDSATLSIHQYHTMDQTRLFRAAEEVCRSFGGRPHWGKQHFLKARDLKTLYPKWDAFHGQRKIADPAGKFMSPYLKELFETDMG